MGVNVLRDTFMIYLLTQPVISECGGDPWVFCTQQLHQIVGSMKPLRDNKGRKKYKQTSTLVIY